MGEWQSNENDMPDTISRSPRVGDRIKQAKYRPLTPQQRQQAVELFGVRSRQGNRSADRRQPLDGLSAAWAGRTGAQPPLHRRRTCPGILLREQGLTIAEIAKRLGSDA